MATKMELNYLPESAVYEFVTENRTILLTSVEISFLSHALEKNAWRAGIDFEIDSNEDNLDFGTMSREELIELCVDDLENRWECGYLNNEPDYQEVVFDMAQENGIWRD